MNTPSHFLMTAALAKALPRVPIQRSAFFWGAIAPDLPLWLLTLGGMIYYRWFLGWSAADTFRLMFDQLYFHHPLWLASHNVLHAPFVLGAGLAWVWPKRRHIGSNHRWLFWFFLACLLHSVVDVFTHADDGPLVFFPLDWQTRFRSPVSYWDSRYFGHVFQWFELALDLACLIYLVYGRLYRLIRR